MGVTLYVLRRLAISLVLLIIASFLVFAGTRTIFDPSARLAQNKDTQARERERARLGLDDPLIAQYGDWISGVVKGDFGREDIGSQQVSDKLKTGFSKTFELALWGALTASCFGITFGIVAAIRRNRPIDYAVTSFSYLGIAVPTFAFAYVLMNMFALWLPALFRDSSWLQWVPFLPDTKGPWLFTTGTTQGSFGRGYDGLWSLESINDYMRHMLMPVMVLSVQLVASWSRYQRASMVEALQSDYIRTAHAKGMSKFRVYTRHALRNSEVPMVTVMALDIGLLFQGLIITEYVFSIPGLGKVFTDALAVGDATTIAGWTIVTATFVVLANLIADLLLPVIDPRIRTQ